MKMSFDYKNGLPR